MLGSNVQLKTVGPAVGKVPVDVCIVVDRVVGNWVVGARVVGNWVVGARVVVGGCVFGFWVETPINILTIPMYVIINVTWSTMYPFR